MRENLVPSEIAREKLRKGFLSTPGKGGAIMVLPFSISAYCMKLLYYKGLIELNGDFVISMLY